VALDTKRKIGRTHAAAIVGHADQFAAAAGKHHFDAGRAGIERVFGEFLHDGRRTLDHLARGDAIDDILWQLADGHGRDSG
jgi:hypothetical protein